MRGLLRWIGWAALALAAALALWWFMAPREPVVTSVRFDAASIGPRVDDYLRQREAVFDDITPGTQKQVLWAGAPEEQRDLSIVYLHGFSATARELSPVPERLAAALGANLVLTRLAGHGRPGSALAQASVEDWMLDVAEALEIGRRTGRRVVVMATSTGATLAALAARDPQMMQGVAGMILISPNFGINNPAAPLLTVPGARWLVPRLVGAERAFETRNADHARFWTARYPTVALLPMAAAVRAAWRADYSAVTVPALFWLSEADRVVRASRSLKIAERWGGPVEVRKITPGPGDDPNAHVIAGDILSPGQTEPAVEGMRAFIEGL